jgi:CheY-like chemotaxis protein
MSKILIADDDPHIRELVCALLRNGGFDAIEAADGRDALTKMTEAVDMAIVDIMMPNMNGYELTRNLRKYYENIFAEANERDPHGKMASAFNLGRYT